MVVIKTLVLIRLNLENQSSQTRLSLVSLKIKPSQIKVGLQFYNGFVCCYIFSEVCTCCISLGEGEVEFEVLEVLQFDSTRKRMSVITRNPNNKELVMFTKGADTAVLGVLHKKFKGRYCGGPKGGGGQILQY